MTREDALLCLQRHATSKISQFADLEKVLTMGFRGEALPSIAAVSKMTLWTLDTWLRIEGGTLFETTTVPPQQGTTIEVTELFFNVPVRKRFLKSPAHDEQEILKRMTEYSLAHPDKTFQLIGASGSLLATHSPLSPDFLGQLKERMQDVLGPESLAQYRSIETERLIGYLGLPAYHRANRTGQTLFINQRPVQSLSLSYAIKDGYSTALPENRFPLFILHLKMAGEEVDVNVHPQKREVRFRYEQPLREEVRRDVIRTFGTASLSIEETPTLSQLPWDTYIPRETSHWVVAETPSLFQTSPFQISTTLKGFIFLEDPSGLQIVDQRALESRVLFEQIIDKKEALARQHLLVPFVITLSPTESHLLSLHLEDFEQVGLTLREFGPHTFALEAVAPHLERHEPQQLIRDLLQGWEGFHRLTLKTCTVPARQLSPAEAYPLLQQWQQCREKILSPSGAPIARTLSVDELAKWMMK